MSDEQWIGIFILACGVYFLVCSIWGRNFLLYRLKANGVAGVFGESAAHRFYTVLGVILIVAGLAKTAGVI